MPTFGNLPATGLALRQNGTATKITSFHRTRVMRTSASAKPASSPMRSTFPAQFSLVKNVASNFLRCNGGVLAQPVSILGSEPNPAQTRPISAAITPPKLHLGTKSRRLEAPRLWEHSYRMHGAKASSRDRLSRAPRRNGEKRLLLVTSEYRQRGITLEGENTLLSYLRDCSAPPTERVLHDKPRKIGLLRNRPKPKTSRYRRLARSDQG